MTTQVPDYFIYQNDLYKIVGLNGKGLLLPENFGMHPINFSTACMRGYYTEYALAKGNLVITAWSLYLNELKDYKEIQGILPIGDTDHFFDPADGKFCMCKYLNLNIPVPYSGGFLIAKDFVKEINVPERPQSYKVVYEFLFENGKLIKAIDWSKEIAKERQEAVDNRPNKPDYTVPFSLKYDFLYTWPRHIKLYAR